MDYIKDDITGKKPVINGNSQVTLEKKDYSDDIDNITASPEKIEILPIPKLVRDKKTNAWVNHVQKYRLEHGISYKEAMSLSKDSYKPML